jgi:hypothetical protein
MPTKLEFDFNYDQYIELLQAVASLSRLFSDNKSPYIDPNFVERLFIHTASANDLSKKYNSFDAHLPASKIGIGIKTFGIQNIHSIKKEKIAELTQFAGKGAFNNLTQEEIALKASGIRNDRVKTDIAEYEIDISRSYYHCLLRLPAGAIIHEEPYSLIDISKITPVHPSKFTPLDKFPVGVGSPIFSDGKNIYSYSISKNVLYKRFDISTGINSELIPLSITEDIFARILKWHHELKHGNIWMPKSVGHKALIQFSLDSIEKPGVDFVILPLYSTQNKLIKKVAPKSGINQWNAGGRPRNFGEAYIPVPADIHNKYPKFFPEREVAFELLLPNGKTESAKICQDGGKALMTNPNDSLCEWLYKVIDPEYSEKTWKERFLEKRPYTYEDLERVGKDSVKVRKLSTKKYSIEFVKLDAYDIFINEKEDYLEDSPEM